jgi:hypothetical protein
MGRGSPRSRNRRGGRNSFYDGCDVDEDDDMADFAPMSGNSHHGRGGGGDFELQPASWAEDAVEEIYGCDPSAAVYAVGQSSMGGGGGPTSRGTSRAGSSRGAMSPFDADEDGYALPSPSSRPKRSAGGGSGSSSGGGGKTRTRCRGLGGGNPLGDSSRSRTAFSVPSAFAQNGALTSSGAAGPKNKKLQRKSAQSLPFRRRSDVVAQRRARGDTSDDSDGEISAEVYLVAPSPAAGPARAPGPVPGQFVLPLQAEVEESTELLFMHFELC